MLKKYDNEFREMYEEMRSSGNPLETIKKYVSFLNKNNEKKVGALELVSCVTEYSEQKSLKQNY
ncbi:hypothetical protein KAJ87_04480 [Candidatus Pacearchaeota archaeon]|nr:hypothetical protein [Candidatus Pacearchaeota archaeon]